MYVVSNGTVPLMRIRAARENVKVKTRSVNEDLVTGSRNTMPMIRGVRAALASWTATSSAEQIKTMVVNSADDEDRPLQPKRLPCFAGADHLFHRPTDVGLDARRQLLGRGQLRVDLLQPRLDQIDQLPNPLRVLGPLELGSQRRLHRAAALVPQDDQQRRAQVLMGVLDAAGDARRDQVAGESNDEQVAKA